MRTFSYTVSNQLKTNLQELDALRSKILTTPLSPKNELKLRWETTIDRVFYSLILADSGLKKREVADTISAYSILKKPKQLTADEKVILKYKKALDLIAQNWLVTDKILTAKTVVALHEVGCTGAYRNKDKDLRQVLEYVQTVGDHPAVRAAIIYVAIIELHAFTDGNARLARLLSLLFLYKSGFDVRGLVCIEKEWLFRQAEYKEALDQGVNSAHVTLWIEYFTRSLINQLEQKLTDVTNQKLSTGQEKKFFNLNERQKTILSLLEEPNATITNRIAQKHFNVSQITASRDLARMSTLGILNPHGRGRSIYYTKA